MLYQFEPDVAVSCLWRNAIIYIVFGVFMLFVILNCNKYRFGAL